MLFIRGYWIFLIEYKKVSATAETFLFLAICFYSSHFDKNRHILIVTRAA